MSGNMFGSGRAGERETACLQGAHRRQPISELLQYSEGRIAAGGIRRAETHKKGQYRLLEKVMPEESRALPGEETEG